MRAHLHRFLLLFLMLALPLQALASASMLGCAFSHQAAMEQVAMAGEMMAGCHEPDQPDSPLSQHDCKHCAVCALASAMPVPAADMVQIVPVPHGAIPHLAASFVGYIPDSPERPPRPSLA